MKKSSVICLLLIFSIFDSRNAIAQCNWQTTLVDSFEYQTVCPDIIPGTTVHNTPQSFAVHSGSLSLYLNFINCVGSTGTCAGDTVYKRHFTVCRNMNVRFSAWLTTSFNGLQCDMHIVIIDGAGNVLDVQPNVLAPYSPNWIQYTSGSVTPTTDDVYFVMITNVGGGGGNDLSMDDFMMETCYPTSFGSSYPGEICSNVTQQNLYQYLPANSDTNGTWSGPSVLGGGYLGTFTSGISVHGMYAYANYYYGTGAGCPMVNDTIVTSSIPAPNPNLGNDTTLCSNQSIILNPGSFPGSNFLWSNGITAPLIVASTSVIAGDTNTYWVQVTASNGCSASDSVTITFVNCTGVEELIAQSNLEIITDYSNHSFCMNTSISNVNHVEVVSQSGKIVFASDFPANRTIYTRGWSKGVYCIRLITPQKSVVKKFVLL